MEDANGVIHAFQDPRSPGTQLAVTGEPLLFLLFLILTVFVLPSVGFEKNSLHSCEDVAASVVAVVGTAIAWRNQKLFLLTSAAVIVAIAFRWATWWRPTQTVRLWSASTGLAAIIMITVVLLWQVFRSGPVNGMRVQGAIAAYLCLAFGWAHAYHIAALVDPNAFNAGGTDVSVELNWINYSFGMLTTVGYAGIGPCCAHSLLSRSRDGAIVFGCVSGAIGFDARKLRRKVETRAVRLMTIESKS
jgi:hypothetical protein